MFSSTTLAGSGLNKPPVACECMVGTCSVCRLASQTRLLAVEHLQPPCYLCPPTCVIHTVCENMETAVPSIALDNLWSHPIPEALVCVLRLVPLSRLQTGWTGSSESEVRQMEASRGLERLAGGPPRILLLERHWP